MLVQFEQGTRSYKVNLQRFHDLTLAINKSGNVNCYDLESPHFSYFKSQGFSGSLDAGGSVNCEKISYYAHASGTHTECALHVLKVDFDMRSVDIPVLQLCRLITVTPEKKGHDDVITISNLTHDNTHEPCEAVVIRTLPNTDEKQQKNYSGINPAYFDPEALTYLQELGYKHILTDLPSIDKESDEGRLAAHKNWFLSNGVAPNNRSITELIYVEEQIGDGIYVLNMQVPKIETDAVPSKILIFPCV